MLLGPVPQTLVLCRARDVPGWRELTAAGTMGVQPGFPVPHRQLCPPLASCRQDTSGPKHRRQSRDAPILTQTPELGRAVADTMGNVVEQTQPRLTLEPGPAWPCQGTARVLPPGAPPSLPSRAEGPVAPHLPSSGPLPIPAAALPAAGGTRAGCAKAPSQPCLPSAPAARAAKGAAGTQRHFFQELLPASPSPSQRLAAVPGNAGGSRGQGEGSTRTGPSRDPVLAMALASQRQYFTGSVGEECMASPISAGAPSHGRMLLPSAPHCPISPG